MSIEDRVKYACSIQKSLFNVQDVSENCLAFDKIMRSNPKVTKESFLSCVQTSIKLGIFHEELDKHTRNITNYKAWYPEEVKNPTSIRGCSDCGMCKMHAHPVDILLRSTHKPLPRGIGYDMVQDAPHIDVEEAFIIMDDHIRTCLGDAYKSTTRCCRVIQVEAGVGKTHALHNHVQENVVYAFKTHALKDEFVANLKVDAFVWKNQENLSDDERRFQQNEYRKTTKPIITTHAKAFHDKETRVVVCDEDPSNEYFSGFGLLPDSWFELRSFCEEHHPSLWNKLNSLVLCDKRMPIFDDEEKEVLRFASKKLEIDEIEFLFCDCIRYCSGNGIRFFPKYRKVPEKLVVLSATPRSEWKDMFPKNKYRKVIVPRVTKMGEVIQCPDFPDVWRGGFSSLSEEKIVNIKGYLAKTGFSFACITRKDLSKPGDVYMHNSCGTNKLSGENICYIGCPYPSPDALTDSLFIRNKSRRLPDVRFTKNGMDYGDPDINKMNREIIRGEVEQGIGRARLIRNQSLVLVLTSEDVGDFRIVMFKDLEKEIKKILDVV